MRLRVLSSLLFIQTALGQTPNPPIVLKAARMFDGTSGTLTTPGLVVIAGNKIIGVGSSAIAALKHDRNAYGCDLDRSYVDVAWERVHQLRAGELRTRPMNKPVYDPNGKGNE